MASPEDYEACIKAMESERAKWFMTPGPKRGDIVRQIGDKIRQFKGQLGSLVSFEMGKSKTEGDGEVQEFIDICDMACGMSRTIDGHIMQSERPGHWMMEVWNPLGIIGVITAFNFPCAVAGWNASIALICGDLMIWKGASTTSLITIAVGKLIAQTLKENGFNSVFTVCQGGGATIGEKFIQDPRL